MIELQGEYGKAKVMIDEIDSKTMSQIYTFLNNEVFTNPISIMPDCHTGSGAVIGFTMKLSNAVVPNVVGVDIGCGIVANKIDGKINNFEKLDKQIRNQIPFGTSIHQTPIFNIDKSHSWNLVNIRVNSLIQKFNNLYNTQYPSPTINQKWFKNKCEEIGMDYDRSINSIGTLGGGNHFIELGEDINTKEQWITIHSGSRQFGLKIALYWQRKAGKGELASLVGEDMFGYLVDMEVAQYYAEENRNTMQNIIHQIIDKPFSSRIESVHNFIDFEDFIIRKGAIRAYNNQKMIIPFNMEDGLIICKGKSNPEWNYSAPHGAGRIGSRRWAKENLSNKDAKERMNKKGIFCSKLPTDELKDAYKDSQLIEKLIKPTAEIITRIKPLLAMKD